MSRIHEHSELVLWKCSNLSCGNGDHEVARTFRAGNIHIHISVLIYLRNGNDDSNVILLHCSR